MSVIDLAVEGISDSKELGRQLYVLLAGNHADPVVRKGSEQLRTLVGGSRKLAGMEAKLAAGKLTDGSFFAGFGSMVKDALARAPELKEGVVAAVKSTHKAERHLLDAIGGLKSLDIAGAVDATRLRPMLTEVKGVVQQVTGQMGTLATPFLRKEGVFELHQQAQGLLDAFCKTHKTTPQQVGQWMVTGKLPKKLGAGAAQELGALAQLGSKLNEASGRAMTAFAATDAGKRFQPMLDQVKVAGEALGAQAQKVTGAKDPMQAVAQVMSDPKATAKAATKAAKTTAKKAKDAGGEKLEKEATGWVAQIKKNFTVTRTNSRSRVAMRVGGVALSLAAIGDSWRRFKIRSHEKAQAAENDNATPVSGVVVPALELTAGVAGLYFSIVHPFAARAR